MRQGRHIFAAALAHELRTPLTILKGRLHALDDAVMVPSTGECARLLQLVDQVLRSVEEVSLFARAHSGEISLDVRPIDLALVVERAIADVQPIAQAAAVEIVANTRTARGRGDFACLVQAVSILLRHLVDRTPSGGRLAVEVEVFPQPVLRISGAADQLLPGEDENLLIPFSPADGRAGTKMTCAIGPALAAAIVDAHGGTLAITAAIGGEGRALQLTLAP
jgi:signal transduction histidine kinase